jgi:hypothetical protein
VRPGTVGHYRIEIMKTLALIFFSLTLSAAAQLPLGSVNDIQPTACTAGSACRWKKCLVGGICG